MSFSTSPKDTPNINPLPTGQPSARDRAIAKLMDTPQVKVAQSQETPVQNPTQVSPEELSAVKAPESESVQADTKDSPSETAPEATKPKEDPLSSQYALLARKERALRAKVQAQDATLKAREAEFAEREAAIKAKEAEYTSNYIPKSRIKSDPLSVLTEEGVSYDELTNAILNPIKQDPRVMAEIERLKAEVQATRDIQTKAKEEYAAQQKQAYTQAVNQIRNDVKQLVATDPAYEMVKETKSVGDVVDLIEKTYKEDGILLSVEEAATEIEEYLVEEAVKLATRKKVQAKLQSAQKPAQPAPQATTPEKQSQPGMKTLTNAVNASKSMSARERAIAAFKGQLK